MTAVSFTTIAQPNPGGVGAKYRSTIAVYGGRYYLPVRKEVRDAATLVVGGRA